MRASFVCSPSIAPRLFSRKCTTSQHLSRRRSLATATAASHHKAQVKPSRIACIGDIHGQWDEVDESALRNLKPDLALFVGDYGDEDVQITRRIANFAASVDFGVATVFGNHDAFFTQSPNGRRRAPYNKSERCRVTEQMELLAPYDVSYRSAGFDDIRLSVCGGRSFSVGGPNWKYNEFYRKFVGVLGLSHSVTKMREAVDTSQYQTLVFLSHSGPTGLGDRPNDPCGKDWGSHPGGDYGDEDLRAAIERAREDGLRVPLAVFGHMHKPLMRNKGNRIMLKTEPDGDSGKQTVMLNAAVFPRHVVGPQSNASLRHVQLVHMGERGDVNSVEEAWVSASGDIVQSTVLYEAGNDVVLMSPIAAAATE